MLCAAMQKVRKHRAAQADQRSRLVKGISRIRCLDLRLQHTTQCYKLLRSVKHSSVSRLVDDWPNTHDRASTWINMHWPQTVRFYTKAFFISDTGQVLTLGASQCTGWDISS